MNISYSMKHWYIILPFDYTDSEQSSGQTICIKNARTPPPMWSMDIVSQKGKYWVCLHIYTAIDPIYNPFQC